MERSDESVPGIIYFCCDDCGIGCVAFDFEDGDECGRIMTQEAFEE
jgi:hypothetical protein